MRKYVLALDLKNDPVLIKEYLEYHENVWPEVTQSTKDAGIEKLDIYLLGTRMIMTIEVSDSFSFEDKLEQDKLNPKLAEWEELMWKFQQSHPNAKPGEKWVLMEKIYEMQ
jgi:L-rhamnose mutarotase